MNPQATKTTVITSHREFTVTIDGRVRRCYPHKGDDGISYRCRLSHADVLGLGAEIPCRSVNYELINGQYVRELGSDRYWPIPALPEFCPGVDIDDEVSLVDPVELPPPPPRNYAGRRARGVSPHWQALLDAARLVAPAYPADHPLRRAIDRCDASRHGERADAEIAAARASMG